MIWLTKHSDMIGRRYRHLKSGREYTLRGIVWDCPDDAGQDGTETFLLVSAYANGLMLSFDIGEASTRPKELDILRLPVTIQNSSKATGYIHWIIYDGADRRLCARPHEEFCDGRFEEINEGE